MGYRPADGAVTRVNPPSLVWLHERGATQYMLQLAEDPAFTRPREFGPMRWNTFTPSKPLKAGMVHWRYRYRTADGRESAWSPVRRVEIPADAVEFSMPTPAEQRERVPTRHPRLFLRPEDLPRLRAASGRDTGFPDSAGGRFAVLRREADRILAAGPTPEPTRRGSARNKEDAEAVKAWWPNREQTVRACVEAETLAFVFLLTGEAAYGAGARRWILHLAAWDPDGPTNFDLNCEAAKPLLHRLSRAYDWAYDALTDADREWVRSVVRRRIADAWKSGEVGQGTGHFNRPYGSHANRTWHKIGESGIAFLGEIPEAEVWLDYAVNKFFALYPVWSDDDGGWHEGVSYWAGYMSKVVWWLQAAESALRIDGLRKPFFAQVGEFPLYVAPPGSPNMGFGDLSHGRPSAGWGGFMDYFIRSKGAQPDGGRAAQWRWWTERWGMKPQDGILGFLYAANLPALPPAAAPAGLPVSRVFQGIGVASLHTTLVDSADDVHLLFKASPFGSQSHGHNPHNSLQLNAYGEALLPACVYRDLHGSRFHYQWAHSTRAQNAVLVDGVGQLPHRAAPDGRIVDFRTTAGADYVVGEATEAYGGRLARYHRHIVFVRDPAPFVVLLDDLEARKPSTFQFMLHALSPFEVDEAGGRLSVRRPKAGLRVDYLAGGPLAFRRWDGFEPPPTKAFPNHWHVEASTREATARAAVFTVLVPARAGREGPMVTERVETPTALGVRVRLGDTVRTVAVRRHGVAGGVVLEGRDFDGPFAVW